MSFSLRLDATRAISSVKRLTGELTSLGTTVDKAQAELSSFGNRLSRLSNTLSGHFAASIRSAFSVGPIMNFDKSIHKVTYSMLKTKSTAQQLREVVRKIGIAYVFYKASQAVKELGVNMGRTLLKLERMDVMLRSAIGGTAEEADKYKQFVIDLSMELGTSLLESIRGFSLLAASIQGTSLALRDAATIYKAVQYSSTALSLSADDTNAIFRAFMQIISKGKVSAEELRQQLAERLPAAFAQAAIAIKRTQAELSQMLKRGELYSDVFMVKYAKQLIKVFEEPAKAAANRLPQVIERFKSSWTLIVERMRKDKMFEPFKQSLIELTRFLRSEDFYGQMKDIVGAVVQGFKDLAQSVIDNRDDIMSVFRSMVSYGKLIMTSLVPALSHVFRALGKIADVANILPSWLTGPVLVGLLSGMMIGPEAILPVTGLAYGVEGTLNTYKLFAGKPTESPIEGDSFVKKSMAPAKKQRLIDEGNEYVDTMSLVLRNILNKMNQFKQSIDSEKRKLKMDEALVNIFVPTQRAVTKVKLESAEKLEEIKARIEDAYKFAIDLDKRMKSGKMTVDKKTYDAVSKQAIKAVSELSKRRAEIEALTKRQIDTLLRKGARTDLFRSVKTLEEYRQQQKFLRLELNKGYITAEVFRKAMNHLNESFYGKGVDVFKARISAMVKGLNKAASSISSLLKRISTKRARVGEETVLAGLPLSQMRDLTKINLEYEAQKRLLDIQEKTVRKIYSPSLLQHMKAAKREQVELTKQKSLANIEEARTQLDLLRGEERHLLLLKIKNKYLHNDVTDSLAYAEAQKIATMVQKEFNLTAGETAKLLKGLTNEFDKSKSTVQEFSIQVVTTMGEDFTKTFTDMMMGVKISFSELLASFTRDFINMATKMLLVEPMLARIRKAIRATVDETEGDISSSLMNFFKKLLLGLWDMLSSFLTMLARGIGGLFGFSGTDSSVMIPHGDFGVVGMATGGLINEPIYGIGKSGQHYLFGEAGPEYITPLNGTARPASPNITVNVVNQGSNDVNAEADVDFDFDGAVINVILRDYVQDGKIRRLLNSVGGARG